MVISSGLVVPRREARSFERSGVREREPFVQSFPLFDGGGGGGGGGYRLA